MSTSGDPLLDALDPDQRLAAEAIAGPVAILAGAGTGKTRTITHRIAYGIQSGRYAEPRTMALTFTTRAAAELRARLRALGAGQVQARTFHAAALAQLGFFWPQVVGGAMPRIVESKSALISEAADALRLDPDAALIRDAAAEIEWRKVSDLTFDEWAASGRRVERISVEQAVALQRAYEDLKDDRRQMDLEDVLLATAGMLASEPGVARAVRDQYRTFVVDEYQDVSPIQHRLLRLWLGDRRDLCVVGDANQTIYTFAGASAQFLLGFASEFPGAEVVRLEVSHRSTQPVLDLANRLMAGRPGALRLTAGARGSERAQAPAADPRSPSGDRGAETKGPAPAITVHPTDRDELAALVAAVAADRADGVAPHQIAVLVRVNAQAPAIEAALRGAGHTVQLRGDARFWEQPHVREAIVHLVAARRTTPPESAAGPVVRAILAGLGWDPEPPGEGAPLSARERWTQLDALHRLAEESAAAFPRFIDELLERQSANDDPVSGSVVIATIHSAKGLEWESVHLPGLVEGTLPISYAETDAEIEEERRLLYVAITRARRRLRLSWARRPTPSGTERAPSRFLADLA